MRRTEKAAVVSVAVSAVMAGGMIAVALVTNSMSILAEGVETVMDVVASTMVLIGLKLSRRRSGRFPTGLYKLENLVGTIIGALILFGAYELAREAIERIAEGKSELESPWLVLVTALLVLAGTFALARYKAKVGREENSPSLVADARHSWADAMACIAVVAGVGLEMLGVPNMDAVFALGVVVFLALTGIRVIVDGLKVLLDASIEGEYLDLARSTAERDARVRDVIAVEGRNSGSYRFLEVSLVPWDFDLHIEAQISEDLEREIKGEIEKVDSVTFTFESRKKREVLVAYPAGPDGESPVAELESAPAFALAVVDAETGDVLYRTRHENSTDDAPGRGARVGVVLSRLGVDVLLAEGLGEGSPAGEVLDENGVRVLRGIHAGSGEEALEILRDFAVRLEAG